MSSRPPPSGWQLPGLNGKPGADVASSHAHVQLQRDETSDGDGDGDEQQQPPVIIPFKPLPKPSKSNQGDLNRSTEQIFDKLGSAERLNMDVRYLCRLHLLCLLRKTRHAILSWGWVTRPIPSRQRKGQKVAATEKNKKWQVALKQMRAKLAEMVGEARDSKDRDSIPVSLIGMMGTSKAHTCRDVLVFLTALGVPDASQFDNGDMDWLVYAIGELLDMVPAAFMCWIVRCRGEQEKKSETEKYIERCFPEATKPILKTKKKNGVPTEISVKPAWNLFRALIFFLLTHASNDENDHPALDAALRKDGIAVPAKYSTESPQAFLQAVFQHNNELDQAWYEKYQNGNAQCSACQTDESESANENVSDAALHAGNNHGDDDDGDGDPPSENVLLPDMGVTDHGTAIHLPSSTEQRDGEMRSASDMGHTTMMHSADEEPNIGQEELVMSPSSTPSSPASSSSSISSSHTSGMPPLEQSRIDSSDASNADSSMSDSDEDHTLPASPSSASASASASPSMPSLRLSCKRAMSLSSSLTPPIADELAELEAKRRKLDQPSPSPSPSPPSALRSSDLAAVNQAPPNPMNKSFSRIFNLRSW